MSWHARLWVGAFIAKPGARRNALVSAGSAGYNRSDQRWRNKLRSKPHSPSQITMDRTSPIALEDLKPWPEHGLAMSTCQSAGCRSMKKDDQDHGTAAGGGGH